MNKQHILFVHIPKTAGTSFRLSLQEWAGDKNTLYDYSLSSDETSKIIIETMYEKKDPYLLHLAMQKHSKLFLSGHFHVGKYMHFFDTINVITFVRDPIQQVFSHYKHYKKYHNYTKSIETFIREERFCNFQSRLLQQKPLELFGFVGIVEQYTQSIEIINDMFGFNLSVLTKNRIDEFHDELTENVKDLIKKNNQKDIALYDKAVQIFQQRVDEYKNKYKYTYQWIQEETNEQIRGLAFYRDNEVVYLNNSIHAKDHRPGMTVHNVPRDAYVGFTYMKGNK